MGGITTTIGKVKYIGIASLTIAILSVLTLNIISSYSSSNIESNAIDSSSEPSTLANDSSICDPTNTNAAACISLSITSSSSSSTGGNDANLSLTIPQGGGIATGRHTVSVSSNNVAGYYVSLNAKSDTTDLVNTNDDGTVNKDHVITSLPVGNDFLHPTVLSNNTWGVALPGQTKLDCVNSDNCSIDGTRYVPDGHEYEYLFHFEENYEDTNLLANALFASIPPQTGFTTNVVNASREQARTSRDIYYGVRVDNPNELLAGSYQAEVVYTATTNEVPMPTITSTSSNTYELGSGADSTVTIAGTNLSSTYKVYIESNTDSTKQYDITSTITNLTDTGLTVTIPTDQTNPDLEPGDYTIHVVTQGGEASTRFEYIESKTNNVSTDYGDTIGSVQVDYDKNMIPIIYDEVASTWRVVTNAQLQQNPDNWFNYSSNEKRWANALTVSQSSLQSFRDKQTGVDSDTTIQTVDNPDILGYWVYIPRYAYKVMRRDAVDKPVSPQNFETRFEKKTDPKKYPAETCSTGTNHQNYLSCPGVSSEYGEAEGTAWATHPAFTFGDQELDGFWVGKFSTTGKLSSPTVKPNQMANIDETIGEFYTSAKSVGVLDQSNAGGSTVTGLTQDSHNLHTYSSSLIKNRDWGAIAYLTNSLLGTGNGNLKLNDRDSDYGTDADGDGVSPSGHVTGCGPDRGYNATQLSSSLIESQTACSQNTELSYDGSLGVQASTTGNIYGIYDMSTNNPTYVAAGISTGSNSPNLNFSITSTIPYVDLYDYNTFTGNSGSISYCTYETCGGMALHETIQTQTIGNAHNGNAWNGNLSDFPYNSEVPWFYRGGGSMGITAGMFGYGSSTGLATSGYHSRIILISSANDNV